MMRLLFIALLSMTVVLSSCKKDDLELTGAQSPIGQVGNTFTTNAATFIPGVSNVTASITANVDGISTITGTAAIDDPDLAAIANALAGFFPSSINVAGNTFSASGQVRFTKDGIAGVYNEGELILVRYDAEVGEEYSLTINGQPIKNKVTARSSDDDYAWGGFFIKVVKVESTGHDLPGVDKVEYYANHRFGMVGVVLKKTDGTSVGADIFSASNNE